MSAAGGIGLRDLGVEDTIVHTIALEWAMRAGAHYNVSYPVYQPWMNVSAALFRSMLDEAGVQVVTGAPLAEHAGAVIQEGARLASVQTVDGRTWTAKVFVDASYEGDLLVRANVSHAYGRESAATYGEPNAGVQKPGTLGNFPYPVLATVSSTNRSLIPLIDPTPLPPVGSADERVMAYSYRLCVTPNRSIQAPFPRPAGYDESRYLLLQRYIDALVASGKYPAGPPLTSLVDIFAYRNFPPGDKFDLCDSADSAVTSDAVNLNAGYVRGSYAERRRIEAEHRAYLLACCGTWATRQPYPPTLATAR